MPTGGLASWLVPLLWNTAASYATSAITNKLFGAKTKSSSPTYTLGALQTQTNSGLVMPLTYGRVKCAGNQIWASPSGTVQSRIISFGLGKIKGFSSVCIDDLLIDDGPIFRVSNSLYADATIRITHTFVLTALILYANGQSYSLILSFANEITTITELISAIRKYPGWEVDDVISTSNKLSEIKLLDITNCYNNPTGVIVNGLSGCSYTAYLGDGEQLIDDRVTGATQEDKAKLVGGLKYDAYLAITATASDRISNFNVTAIVEGRIVRIYDTMTTYTEKWSDNPAWCELDFKTSVDGCGMEHSSIDLQMYLTAGNYYDQLVNGKKRFTLNLILDEKKTRQDWLTEIFSTCRSYPTYQRGLHGILVDKPEEVSQVFNVKPDESIETWWQDNAEDIERLQIEYIDPDYEYTKVVAQADRTQLPGETSQFRNKIPLTKKISIYGINNFVQASREAWFHLNKAQTCPEWIQYTTNKKALNRSIGDVVGIWNPITEVTEPGLSYKRYRIMTMNEPQENNITMVMQEYNPNLYDFTMGSVASVINITALENPNATPPDVSNIQLVQIYYRQNDGTIISYITGSCTLPDYRNFSEARLEYSIDSGSTWSYTGKTDLKGAFIIDNVKTGISYLIRIKVSNRMGIVSDGIMSDPIYINGKDQPPSDVPSLVAAIDTTDSTKITLSWPAITDIDLRGYRIMEGNTILTPTPITDTRYIYTATSSRQHNFSVVAIDNSSNPSDIPAIKNINVTIEPAQVAGFSVITLDSDKSRLRMTWTANNETDLNYYEIRIGQVWSTAILVATQLKATLFECQLSATGSLTYLIKAVNVAGKSSINPTAVTQQYTLTPNAPASGAITQDVNDKSVLLINWAAVSDKDLSQYEIRLGTNWATGTLITTTKEITYKYKVSIGGVYNFMICSKNIAGYPSAVLNLQIMAYLKPSNVVGFSITSSATDRRVLNCLWTAVTDADLSCYEIRQGTNWDTATVVAKQITSNFCSIQFVGGNATFLIKAVNVSGNYSDAATSFAVAISVAPNTPGGGSVIADSSNRLKLTLNWGAITDTDLLDYEIRVGSTWAIAAFVANTKETSYAYTVAAGSAYTFLISSRTVGSQYSQPRSLTVAVKQEPSDIATFTATQSALDRRTINFAWTTVIDTDLSGYGIRKGTSWDSATVIANNVSALKYDYTATIEETATFLIKAITTGGKYSITAKAINITIQLKPNAPETGVITQDNNNSTIQVLSWGAVTDADLSYYEIRIGATWASGTLVATTKELSYKYTATDSTSLSLWIAAKNIGGYYSQSIQLTTIPNINPNDVSGFTVAQMVQDHSTVRLIWGVVTNKDFSYYEIREGITWDVGTVVGTRLTGLYYDSTINSERMYNYWIKAFNIAGNGSLNPAAISSIFSMHPTVPDGLTVITDSSDKTKLNISWNSIADQDLKEYELRVGISWSDSNAVIITKTKETKSVYYPPKSQNYHFMLVARNNTNWISDIVEIAYTSYIEPADVTGFHAMQNGANSLVAWDKVGESDVTAYEIREGSNFDNGSLVTTGINTLNYQVAVDTEKTYRYWIKAINRAGKYSQNAMSAEVTIAGLPAKNVIESFNEITLKTGAHTNTEFGTSLINMSNIGGRFSDYPNTKFSDVGGQIVLKLKKVSGVYPLSGEYLVQRKDAGQIITANISSQFVSTNLLTSNVNAKLQYRISRDGTSFTDWQDFQPIEATFRYVDFKVVMASSDTTKTPEVNILQEIIDVPDNDEYGTATIAVGGTTVSYGYTFYDYPASVPTAIGAGLRAELQSVGKSNFVVKVLNTAGTDVGGQITWIAKGY